MLRLSAAKWQRCSRMLCRYRLGAVFSVCLVPLCLSCFPFLASSGDFARVEHTCPSLHDCRAATLSGQINRLPVNLWPAGLLQLRGGEGMLDDGEESNADQQDQQGLWEFPVDQQSGMRKTTRKRPPSNELENEIVLEKDSAKDVAGGSESSEEILDEEEWDRREEELARKTTIEDFRKVNIPKETVEVPRTRNVSWDEDFAFDKEDTRPMDEKRDIFNAWVDKQPPEEGEPLGQMSPLWDASIVKDQDEQAEEDAVKEEEVPAEDLARSKEWAQTSPQEEHQNQQDSALIAACEDGDMEAVAAAIARGADVNAPNFLYSPLCIAVVQGSCELVHALAELGADVENMGVRNREAAKRKGAVEGRARTEENEDEEDEEDEEEDNADEHDDDDVRARHVGSSLAYGRADCTPLQLAAKEGRPEMVQLLLHLGADVNRKDSLGGTALHVAAREGRVGCIAALVEGGADINAQNSFGRTALHDAVFAKRARVIKKLLSLGADVTKEDDDGCSANMIARRFRKAQSAGDLLKLLRAQSAYPAALAKPTSDMHQTDESTQVGSHSAVKDHTDMDDERYFSSDDVSSGRASESNSDESDSSSRSAGSEMGHASSVEEESDVDARDAKHRPDADHRAGKCDARWPKLGRLGASDGKQVLL